MSGHSKWSTIKRKKGAADAARGKIFTKIAREIMVAARQSGGEPNNNPRLRSALLAARAANMPRENQERAIKKGTGDLEGAEFIEVVYEGRGPQGSAFVLEVMTDNRNRTVPELRSIFGKGGGEMGSDGTATWMFDRKGVVVLAKEKIGEDKLMELAIEAGAEDVRDEDEVWVVISDPASFSAVQAALDSLEPESTELRWLVKPENATPVSGDAAQTIARLWAKFDEHDDVQKVYCNVELPEDVAEEFGI